MEFIFPLFQKNVLISRGNDDIVKYLESHPHVPEGDSLLIDSENNNSHDVETATMQIDGSKYGEIVVFLGNNGWKQIKSEEYDVAYHSLEYEATDYYWSKNNLSCKIHTNELGEYRFTAPSDIAEELQSELDLGHR